MRSSTLLVCRIGQINALRGVLHFPLLCIVLLIFAFVAAFARTATGTAQETDASIHKVSCDSYYLHVYGIFSWRA